MNTEDQAFNALVWIESLKTGGYKQGKEQLGEWEDGYCCLGVACVVTNVKFSCAHDLPQTSTLQKRVGLATQTGECDLDWYIAVGKFTGGTNDLTSLYAINDDVRGMTFKKIAELLSKVPEAYFTPEVAAIIKETYS